MPNSNPVCRPPGDTCDPNEIPTLQSIYPKICVFGGFLDTTIGYLLLKATDDHWEETTPVGTTYKISCVSGKWNISWEGPIASGNEDATSGTMPNLTFPSFDTFIAAAGTCSRCGQCIGAVADQPSTLFWHNQTTSQSYTLSHSSGYNWIDATNTYEFFCDDAADGLAIIDHSTQSGDFVHCNHSDPLSYIFMINGETITIST